MTEAEKTEICKALAVSCMWGHGGIASTVIESLDKALPGAPKWSEVYRANTRRWKREAVGVIDDERWLKQLLGMGYWLVNFDEEGCSLFNPPPMNGLRSYVSKRLADKFKIAA